jgi:ABC-type transport system involved in multi-copper enzyme maturation permease subunit
MRAIWAVARMQLLSIWRRKLLWLPIAVALLLLLLLVLPVESGNGGDELLVKEGLAHQFEQMLFFAGTFFGILVGSSSIASDVESGTMLIVAVRPIQRWQVFLGKVLGGGLALLACFVVWGLILAAVLEVRFDATAGYASIFRFTFVDVLLSYPASLLMLVVATTLSAFMGSRGASTLALIMWAAASLFGYVADSSVHELAPKNPTQAAKTSTSAAIHLARAYTWMVPKDHLLDIPDIQGNAVDDATWQPTRDEWIALGVLLAWIVLGSFLFQQRESLAKSAE